MIAYRLVLAVAVGLLSLPVFQPPPARAEDPKQFALPVTELGGNWSVTPGSARQIPIAASAAYLVEYQNSADYPSPRKVNLDIRVFPSPSEAEALLAGFSNVGVWKPLDGLGDGTALFSQGPTSTASGGRYAGSTYWFRVAHVAAQVRVLGLPDLQTVDAQARQLTLQQEAWIRRQLGQSEVSNPSPGLTARPTPPAILIVNDCARFIADVTIPDGSQIAPGQTFEKVWRAANCGDTTWDGYRAVRATGTFGPESFEIPPTPPGAEVDLRVTLQAPATIGEHNATYRLLGPGYPFGGFTVVVDVADCSPHAVAAIPPGAELTPSGLLMGNTEMSGRWCLVSEEHEARWSMVLYNSAEYGSPRRMQVWTSVWPSEALAEQALLGFPKGILASEDPGSYRPQDATPWDVEGGYGQRIPWSVRNAGFAGIDYVSRIGRVVSWVQGSGGLDQLAELDGHAQAVALAQATKVRTAVSVAAPAPERVPPGPDAVYAALLTTPFSEDELPPGFSRVVIRGSGEAENAGGVAPQGTVSVLVSGPDASGPPEAGITYTVYRAVADAEAAFKGFVGFAYVHVPRTVPSPMRCSGGGPLQNRCIVLAGNVVIYGDARAVDFSTGSIQVPPPGPTADGMALVGLAHLERVIGSLPSVRTPVMVPSAAMPAPALMGRGGWLRR